MPDFGSGMALANQGNRPQGTGTVPAPNAGANEYAMRQLQRMQAMNPNWAQMTQPQRQQFKGGLPTMSWPQLQQMIGMGGGAGMGGAGGGGFTDVAIPGSPTPMQAQGMTRPSAGMGMGNVPFAGWNAPMPSPQGISTFFNQLGLGGSPFQYGWEAGYGTPGNWMNGIWPMMQQQGAQQAFPGGSSTFNERSPQGQQGY